MATPSVVVLTLYISNLDAAQLYQHTNRLWLLVPVLLLWISRLWLTASRGELNEDPVVYAITDRPQPSPRCRGHRHRTVSPVVRRVMSFGVNNSKVFLTLHEIPSIIEDRTIFQSNDRKSNWNSIA